MDAMIWSEVRRRELLVEAERERLGRMARLARSCHELTTTTFVSRVVAALRGRDPRPAAC